jgi:hypothetical protein
VRVIVLKARQMGFSTYAVAVLFERLIRDSNIRALIVAHKRDTSIALLDMVHTARKWMPCGDGSWALKETSRARYRVSWADPIGSAIDLTSAEVDEPGHGFTCQAVNMSETSRWPDAYKKAKGVLQIIPDRPGTIAFSESTANGAAGWFYDEFNAAWDERHLPLGHAKRESSWVAMFYPWFWHHEYRWTQTYGSGRSLPKLLKIEIRKTMDDEERWLLKQKFLRKGLGWVKVDIDQLAWRRLTIRSKCSNSIVVFNEQYPSRPELAFQASGNPAYDTEQIQRLLKIVTQTEHHPVWRGAIQDTRPVSVMNPMEVL